MLKMLMLIDRYVCILGPKKIKICKYPVLIFMFVFFCKLKKLIYDFEQKKMIYDIIF